MLLFMRALTLGDIDIQDIHHDDCRSWRLHIVEEMKADQILPREFPLTTQSPVHMSTWRRSNAIPKEDQRETPPTPTRTRRKKKRKCTEETECQPNKKRRRARSKSDRRTRNMKNTNKMKDHQDNVTPTQNTRNKRRTEGETLPGRRKSKRVALANKRPREEEHDTMKPRAPKRKKTQRRSVRTRSRK